MREKLKGRIRLGFEKETRSVIIQDQQETGAKLPRSGMLSGFPVLSRTLRALSLPLPVTFRFSSSSRGHYWTGRIEPDGFLSELRHSGSPPSQDMLDRLWNSHGWIAERCIHLYGKSTPIAERRSIAAETFVRAAQSYVDDGGSFVDYITTAIRQELVEGNRRHLLLRKEEGLSMDAELCRDPGRLPFTRYHLLPGSIPPAWVEADERLAREDFIRRLTRREEQVYSLLSQGYSGDEITGQLGISPARLEVVCCNIRKKQKAFLAEDEV